MKADLPMQVLHESLYKECRLELRPRDSVLQSPSILDSWHGWGFGDGASHLYCVLDVALEVLVAVDDLHGAAAQHIRGAHHTRVAQPAAHTYQL